MIRRFTHLLSALQGNPREAPLWNRLDACGIPFRTPMQDLIDQYGAYPIGWSENLDTCTPPGTAPFIEGLDHQPTFQFSKTTDLNISPNYLFCAVSDTTDHRLNYARAIQGLTQILGKGTAASASNTVAREWRFGHALLKCTVFPPDQQDNHGRNSRHDMFPETRTEASITIEPAWRPPLSPQELKYCQTARHYPTQGCGIAPFKPVGPLTRDWPKTVPALPMGPAFAQDDAAFLATNTRGLVDILPREWITGIGLDRITAARGGAYSDLVLKYAPSGRSDLPKRRAGVAKIYGQSNALDEEADALGKRLRIKIERYDGPND